VARERTEVLAVIGARSGSRALPGKNVAPLVGHPLLAWIVSAARRAATVDRVVVSTDSEEYAAVARRYGAEVPYLRPAELASDDATDVAYVAHLLDWLEAHEGYRPDVVLRLLPTVPMQAPEDLDAVVAVLVGDHDATSAMVVAEARQHPAKALRIAPDAVGRARLVAYVSSDGPGDGGGGAEPTARQSHPPAYFRANVVATRPVTVRSTGTLAGDRVAVHIIDRDRGVDIDSADDLHLAELLMGQQDPPIPPPVAVGSGSEPV
jgi:CMP-N,N'-diacetyllegionaminic acid synthase